MRNHEGVLLRYADPSVRRPHHDERRPQPSDSDRNRLIEAEREWFRLLVLAQHLDAPEYALNRIEYALEAIRMGLGARRRELGMADVTVAA